MLAYLSARDHSQRELAAATGVTEQTMSRILARMERLGYVTRKPHRDDRRRHVISLTAAGRAVLRGGRRPRAQRGAGRYADWTPEQVGQLRRTLAAIIAAHPDPADDAVDDRHHHPDRPPSPRRPAAASLGRIPAHVRPAPDAAAGRGYRDRVRFVELDLGTRHVDYRETWDLQRDRAGRGRRRHP